MQMQDKPGEANFERALAALRRRAPWLILCVLLVAAAAFMTSQQQTKKYTAMASLLFSGDQLSQQLAGLQPTAAATDVQDQQAANIQLVELGSTAKKTAAALDHGLTEDSVKGSLDVSGVGTTNVIEVAATSTSPHLAARIANTYSKLFVAEEHRSNRQDIKSALALVNKQLGALSQQQRFGQAGLALQNRAQSLTILDRVQPDTVRIAQAATVPESPSSPKIARNTIVGAVLGLLLGIGVALLLERRDRRLKDPEELGESFSMPVLGTIPGSRALADGHGSSELPPLESEAFRMLRGRLRYFDVDRKIRSVLVTSGEARDGKSTIAWNLALTEASLGSETVLLECDFHQPSLAARRGLKPAPGLSELLTGQTDLVVQHVPVGNSSNGRKLDRRLDVVTAGARPPNPVELMESDEMAALIRQLTDQYDLVVIDTPASHDDR